MRTMGDKECIHVHDDVSEPDNFDCSFVLHYIIV
jgi:hypothetical protein